MKTRSIIALILFCLACTPRQSSDEEVLALVKDFQKKYYKELFVLDVSLGFFKFLVNESYIYICDQKHGHIDIFSRKNGAKVKTFGEKGEGPGSFINIFDIRCQGDKLYICSFGKLSIYTEKGELVKEIRSTVSYTCYDYIPIAENFVTKRLDWSKIDKKTVSEVYCLLDPTLKNKKDLLWIPFKYYTYPDKSKTAFLIYQPCRRGEVYKDRLYLGSTDLGFYIAVFDSNGNKLYEINRDDEKIRVTDSIKNRMINAYKTILGDNFADFARKREFEAPEFIPAFMDFFIHNDRIYVIKFPLPGSKTVTEALLLDLKGNTLAKRMIPLGNLYKLIEEKYTSFYNGKLYFISPTEDDENTRITVLDLEAIFK